MYPGRAAAGAFLVVMVGLPAAAGAAPLYRLLDVGTLQEPAPPLENVFSGATDINELGQVVGYSFAFSQPGQLHPQAFRTAPNSPINRLTDGLDLAEARHINAPGQVAGQASFGNALATGPNQRSGPPTRGATGGYW